MNDKQQILEPSFAEAISDIEAATSLASPTRRHLATSLRSVARAFDQPPETIPARYSAVRARLAALHHVPLGWEPKTLQNHKSNAKSALLWFCKEKRLQPEGTLLTPDWERLLSRLIDPSTRYRLTPLMRFCSAIGAEPRDVDEKAVDQYFEYRARTTNRSCSPANRRILARLWNACVTTVVGWPNTILTEPPVLTRAGPRYEDFPASLRKDIEEYQASLTRIRKTQSGQRLRPCKPSTVTMRGRELIAAVRMAARAGIPLENLTSLRSLVAPDIAIKTLDAYWQQDGEIPRSYTINLAQRFLGLGHYLQFDRADLERLGDVRFRLAEYREEGMTPKNLALIRQVLTPGMWQRVIAVPETLMQRARSLRRTSPIRAGVSAQIATAVSLLSVAPVRLSNLAGIQLEEHLTKPGGPDTNYWLAYRMYDTKNRQPLQFALDETVTSVIDEYVHDYRPKLLRGSNSGWLFPGASGKFKEKISFSTQIVGRIRAETGIRITVHQFRHAAGALLLKHHPGNYELVRRVLGHKSIETTRKFYCDLDTTQASEIFNEIVRKKLDFRPETS